MRRPRVLLLTSNGLRHRYAAQRLAADFELAGILAETKRPAIAKPEESSDEDLGVMQRHLAERDGAESRILGRVDFPAEVERLEVAAGEANSAGAFDWVREREPDAVVLYGTSIIRPPLLTHYDGRMVNMHLGLSPYYKGAGTNFWPLVDGVPECVGATIHLAIPQVDAGPVLTQVRPDLAPEDRAHEIGTKAIVAGLEALVAAVDRFLAGELDPVAQDLGQGRVFRRKDFNSDAVRRMWERLDSGMVPAYLEDQEARRDRHPILERV